MKKSIVLLITVLYSIGAFPQTTLNDILKGCIFGSVENDKIEHFKYINSHGEKATCSIDDMAALLRKDVVAYYGLGDKYNTELKIKTFKQTDDYNDTFETLMEEYNYFTQGKGYVMYNLRYNSDYDTAKRCFLFKVGFDDMYRYSKPGYLCFGGGLSLTYPSAYLSRTRQESQYATNGIYNYNILKTTIIPEATALKIENEMENPYCNARLLIIFKLTTTSQEKKQVANYLIPQNFVIGKAIGAYIVNEKTGEVYADMSSAFVQKPKPASQRKK
jgi:hypothetical protein